MPPLAMMIKPASSACNMRCRYCFYADVASHRETASYGLMQPETMHELIRRAFHYADRTISFAFQGGEPTLAGLSFFQDFVRTVDQYNTRHLEIHYALQTNGTLLTAEFCRFLAEHHFLTGVSLDGSPALHDALRRNAEGQGTHAEVLRGLRLLKKTGAEYNILCVVTQPVALHARECWDSLKEHKYLQFIPCIDDFDRPLQDYSLTASAYGQFLIDTFGLYEAAFFSGHPVSERRFDNYLSLAMGMEPEACGMRGGCGNYFLVESDGSVYPCDFYVLDAWRMGNVHQDSLMRMRKSGPALHFAETARPLPSSCMKCSWLSICRGGCRRDREPLGENKYCESYRMFFESCWPRVMSLARKVMH